MPAIISLPDSAIWRRTLAIPPLLLPLLPDKAIHCLDGSSLPSRRIFSAYSGRRPDGNVTSWRCDTAVPNLVAHYREQWSRSDEPNIYDLDLIYLHLLHPYMTVDGDYAEREVFFLHCELSDTADTEDDLPLADPRAKLYTQGLHVHVKAAWDPLPRTHIAMHLGHSDNILDSLTNLEAALTDSIEMIEVEVLGRILKARHGLDLSYIPDRMI